MGMFFSTDLVTVCDEFTVQFTSQVSFVEFTVNFLIFFFNVQLTFRGVNFNDGV